MHFSVNSTKKLKKLSKTQPFGGTALYEFSWFLLLKARKKLNFPLKINTQHFLSKLSASDPSASQNLLEGALKTPCCKNSWNACYKRMSIIYLGSEDTKLYDSLIILLSCLLRAQLKNQTSLYTQIHFYIICLKMLIWKVLNNNGLIGAKFASTLPISSVIARFSPFFERAKKDQIWENRLSENDRSS